MNAAVALSTASKPTQERINEVRIYLRVTTIADLADETGVYIPDEMLCREWRAGSNLRCPKSTRPDKKSWMEFGNYTTAAFTTGTKSHQSTSNVMIQNVRLGPWRAVEQSAWFPWYRDGNLLYQRSEDVIISVMAPGGMIEFYYRE